MGGGAGGQGHCLNKGGGLARAELVGLPPRLKKFVRDIEDAFLRLSQDLPPDLRIELEALKDKLVELKAEGKVKINHSVMELVCAKELLAMGYSVDVEHEIGGLPVVDRAGSLVGIILKSSFIKALSTEKCWRGSS